MASDKTDTNRKPEDTLRDGALKATIWKNEGEKGSFYNATISKTYRDDRGEYRDTQSFSSNDLLRVSELSRKAHNRVLDLKREQSRDADRDVSRNTDRTQDRGRDR